MFRKLNAGFQANLLGSIMPGVSSVSSRAFPAAIGSSWILRLSITWPSDADAVSRSGVPAATSTRSLTPPTVTVMLSSVVSLTLTCTLPRDQGLNPLSSAVTVYNPGGRNGILYIPSWLVWTVARTPVAAFAAETDAPGTDALEESTTRPRMEPRGSWAKAVPIKQRIAPTETMANLKCIESSSAVQVLCGV